MKHGARELDHHVHPKQIGDTMTMRHQRARALAWALGLIIGGASATSVEADEVVDDAADSSTVAAQPQPPIPSSSLRTMRTDAVCAGESSHWEVFEAQEEGFRVYTFTTASAYTNILSAGQRPTISWCNVEAQIAVPEGSSYALARIDVDGTAKIETNASAQLSLRHESGAWPKMTRHNSSLGRDGPYEGVMNLQSIVSPPDQVWTACGASHLLRFGIGVDLRQQFATPPPGTARFTLSRDGRTTFVVRFAVKPCA